MNPDPSTYPPLDRLKPVANGVWVVDSGPIRVLGMPLPIRMTVIRLADGALILHSPTRFDFELRRELDQVGQVRHLVGPNSAHWMFLKQWQDHIPEVMTWAAPGLRQRGQVRRSGVTLDRDLADDAPEAWGKEIEQVVVPGAGGFAEVALFHTPSRTLVLTDLIQNLELAKLPALMRPAVRLVGSAAPDGKAPVYLRAVVKLGGERARAAGKRLVELRPERVIFTHGRWFEQDGTARLRRSLAWLLGDA